MRGGGVNVTFSLFDGGEKGSDVFRPFWRPVYPLGRPNSGAKKTVIKFSFFSCISTKNALK